MQTLKSLEKWVTEHKFPKYRSKQIYQAITKEHISDWHEAKGLPKDLQDILVEELEILVNEYEKVIKGEEDILIG